MTFRETIYASFMKSAGKHYATMDANRSFVISNHQLNNLLRDHEALRERLLYVTDLEPRLPSFHVRARKVSQSQRLLLYNGSGGYGDQILTWPVAKILSDLGFEIHVLTDPGNLVCWSNFSWVKSVTIQPIAYEIFKMFDYHLIMEHVTNADEHPDQGHTVDRMLTKIGIDPRSIDPKIKAIAPAFTVGENRSAMGAFPDKELAFYQLSAASHMRSLTPDDSTALLACLADTFPEWHWLAVHDEFINKAYAEKTTALQKSNVQTLQHGVLRELWALARRAKVVVAPDSMMIHVAGSMGIPCVGLWGPVHPDNRTQYYANHVPIFQQSACYFAPCHNYTGEWPRYCPNREKRTQCDVMSAITHTDVVHAICKVTNSPQRDPRQRDSYETPAVWSADPTRVVDSPLTVSTT